MGGCLPRTGPGYDALAGQVVVLAADIAAFQEVENAAAAAMLVANSIRELPCHGPHLDQRAVSAAFTSGGGSGGTGAPLSGD